MAKDVVWVVGHRNPDTDSICAAIAYANLKNQVDKEKQYIAKRAGDINGETAYVLDYFKAEQPKLIKDVGTQLKDISMRKTEGVNSQISLKKAWDIMKTLRIATLPVVSQNNKLKGMVVMADIAKSYMDMTDTGMLSAARTRYKNIIETLDGTLLTGNEHGHFVRGKVVMGIDALIIDDTKVESDDLVIVGDREEAQLQSIACNCSCMIVTNGLTVSHEVLEAASRRDVVVISTPYNSYLTACLLNQSMPIKYFMTKKGIINFHLDDYVADVNVAVSNVRHRDFPILDDDQNYVGMFSRRNLLSAQKKQIILVDHNEKSQAVNNIAEAEILEIIDHHRLGSLETNGPVYFRNQPLGCTSTIVYHMYLEKGVEISKQMAGLMCSAILSDTLVFRSPTCTELDKEAAKRLAEIAQIEIEEHATHMFEAGSDFANKTEEEILNQDFKIFHSGDISFGVSQVSAMSTTELKKVHDRVSPVLNRMLGEKRIDMMFVMLTNIIRETTVLVCSGDEAMQLAQEAFAGADTEDDGLLLKGVVSRKKQLIPELINALND